MLISEVKKLKPLDRFLYWVKERYSIFTKKEAGKKRPWTDDTILQSCYFTNVHRENDKVTRWYAKNIREPLKDDPAVFFATIAFRWFNWPATGEVLMGNYEPSMDWSNLLLDWDTRKAVSRLESIQELGAQIFTGAFNISNSGSTKPKINRVCEDYIEPVWKDRATLEAGIQDAATLASVHRMLKLYPGLGGSGFMAAQVVADLKYTPFLEDASDWDTFCCLGPGSKRGLNRLLGRTTGSPMPLDWRDDLEHYLDLTNEELPDVPPIHAQDFQSCLCEWDKMERVLWNQGRSKRTYNGKT
jgi:hypothetical protein